MKPQTLPVKRRPAVQGIFKKLRAVTGNQRKQRVAATATPEVEYEDGSSKIARALTIIFLIHIVAIGLIFVHQNFLEGRAPEETKVAKPESATAAVMPAPRRADLPQLSRGEMPYIVSQGDNYSRISAELEVDEGDLRLLNKHAEIVPGLILKIPPKRIVATEPAEIAEIREQNASMPDRGLVENIDIAHAPRAQLIRPNTSRSSLPAAASDAPKVSSSGKSYVVQSGDSVWRIANKFKVSQDALMKANGITDVRKMKTGMSLVIP